MVRTTALSRPLHHLPPEQSIPKSNHLSSEKILPGAQPKPPRAQLEAMSSRPVMSRLREETNPHLVRWL